MPPKYTHLSQRNQILKRPAQHIGSVKTATRKVWIAQTEYADGSEIERIVEQEIEYNPGLVHIFYEVLSNAQDNFFMSKDTDTPLRKIEVTVDQETGEITIWNDGLWIPNVIHKWGTDEEIIDNKPHYEAEIIFGHLNTSGNYDDEKIRIGSGLHGLGVKLTNIFSSTFSVDCFDPDTGIRFRQTYTDNMENAEKPHITKLKQKKGFTKISYIADFKRFGIEGYSDELVAAMKKLCVDCAMVTGQKVLFNSEKIPLIKNFGRYVGYYTDSQSMEFKSNDSTVILCEKVAFETGFAQISFVNGVYTNRGGVHVDEWRRVIFKPLLEKIKSKYSKGKGKKSTSFKMTMKNLENYFIIFLNCNLDNPDFEGQTKGVLCSPIPETNVPSGKITSLMKWGFVNDIEETVRIQGMKELAKTDGKRSVTVSISKADDANKAGTVKSGDCTLFITEGDSAKAFAIKGISAIEHGTDWFGVLPVRGKPMNVRTHTAVQINKNKEISEIKKMLGLKHGVDYTDPDVFRTLRYGKVCILTDADLDGDHIKGLIINFFQHFYPALLSCKYLVSIRTPIVKATIGKKILTFYYIRDFKSWAESQTQKFTVKYYKGLGTSTDAEIYEIFEKPRNVQYIEDKLTAESVETLFGAAGTIGPTGKKYSDMRKEWLENYTESEFKYPEKNGAEQVNISEFINNEMIGFSIYDNQRSIPSVVDGFKPSQRKAMWVALRILNQTKDFKVNQFANEVSKQSDYHHGETSMEQTIIGMVQSFVGANNITMLYESGQYGTRLSGGKDASASRYIFTRLSSIARYIFRKEDDPILEYLEEDGNQIEPRYFVPVIPMLLVNGCRGIGTGYSTSIPSFNPMDLVAWITAWLNNQDPTEIDLLPWYWGFKGYTERDENNLKRIVHYGQVEYQGGNLYEITELPIGTWTDDYKDLLNSLKTGTASKKEAITGYEAMTVAQLKEHLGEYKLAVSGTKKELITRLKEHDKKNGITAKKTTNANGGQAITKWEWHGDAYTVRFKIWTKPGVVIDYDNPKFKLTAVENLTNMTAFTPDGGIKKYSELSDILETFCEVRLRYYQRRKKYLVIALKNNIRELQAKSRFINAVLADYTLLKQTEDSLFAYFGEKKYWKKNESYRYLTDMPVRNFTADKHQLILKQIADIEKEIEYVQKKAPKQMWLQELSEFTAAYKRWKADMEKLHSELAKKKIKRRRNVQTS